MAGKARRIRIQVTPKLDQAIAAYQKSHPHTLSKAGAVRSLVVGGLAAAGCLTPATSSVLPPPEPSNTR